MKQPAGLALAIVMMAACSRSSTEPAPETHPEIDAATYMEMAMAGSSPTALQDQAKRHPDLDHPIFLANGDVPDDFAFSYRLSGCFGSCPTFDIAVDATGIMTFQSSSDAVPKGRTSTCTKRLGVAGVKSLVHLLDTKTFFRPAPPRRGPTDHSHQIVEVHMSGRDHNLDVGGGFEPAEQKRIDALLDAVDAFFKLDPKTQTLPSGC